MMLPPAKGSRRSEAEAPEPSTAKSQSHRLTQSKQVLKSESVEGAWPPEPRLPASMEERRRISNGLVILALAAVAAQVISCLSH